MAESEVSVEVDAGLLTMHLQEVVPQQPVRFFNGVVELRGKLLEFFDCSGNRVAEQPPGVAIIESFGRVFFAAEEVVEKIPLRAD